MTRRWRCTAPRRYRTRRSGASPSRGQPTRASASCSAPPARAWGKRRVQTRRLPGLTREARVYLVEKHQHRREGSPLRVGHQRELVRIRVHEVLGRGDGPVDRRRREVPVRESARGRRKSIPKPLRASSPATRTQRAARVRCCPESLPGPCCSAACPHRPSHRAVRTRRV